MIIKHKNDVISELHLDYLRPIKKRGCEIVGENGTLIWESEGKNPEKCVVKFCDRKSNQYKELLVNNNIDINYCYEILAKEFITSIENSSNDKLLMAKDAIKQLKIIKNCKILD